MTEMKEQITIDKEEYERLKRIEEKLKQEFEVLTFHPLDSKMMIDAREKLTEFIEGLLK